MYDDYYDPPSDPYWDEVRCPICDAPMEYSSYTREWYCDEHECLLIICENHNCFFEYDGPTKEVDVEWTIACPECGCDVRVTEYNLEG